MGKKVPFYRRQQFVIWLSLILPFMVFCLFFSHEIGSALQPLKITLWFIFFGRFPKGPLFTTATLHDSFITFFNLLFFSIPFLIALVSLPVFILPVDKPIQIIETINRLIAYLYNQHGAAMLVREGKSIASQEELKRRGIGLVLVDLSSAVVMETYRPSHASGGSSGNTTVSIWNLPFSRKKGPPILNEPGSRVEGAGVIFTKRDEQIKGVIDLRTQNRRNSNEVKAYTSDGIEIATNINTTFTLGEPPQVLWVTYCDIYHPSNLRVIHIGERYIRENTEEKSTFQTKVVQKISDDLDAIDKEEIFNFIQSCNPELTYPSPLNTYHNGFSPYRFNRQNVFSALYSQARNPQKSDYTQWTELPPLVATEKFRELLTHHTYEHIYRPIKPNDYPLVELREKLNLSVRNLGILAFQFVLRRDGREIMKDDIWDEQQLIVYPIQELQNPKVLRARGIKVLNANFTELVPVDPRMRQYQLDRWSLLWDYSAQSVLNQHEFQAIQVRNQARAQAQADMLHELSSLLHQKEYSDEISALLVFEALERAASDPDTHRLLPNETINMLQAIHNWFAPGQRPPSVPPVKS